MTGPRTLFVRILIGLLVAGCAGPAASTSTDGVATTPAGASTLAPDTTPAADTTLPDATTEATSTTLEDPSTATGSLDIAPECLELFHAYVADLEPVVSSFDFEGANFESYEQLEADAQPALSTLYQNLATECPTFGQGASPDLMIQLEAELAEHARREVPGAAMYFELSTAEPQFDGEGGCDAAFAALESYLAQGGTFGDLPPVDKLNVTGLYAEMTTFCGLSTDEVIAAFLAS